MKFWSIDTCCFINHVYIAQNVIDGPQYNYTQYPIIRNGDQRWALEFLKNYQFPDADRFLILQGWALAVS